MAFVEADWHAHVPVTIDHNKVPGTMPDGGESGFPVQVVIKNSGDNWEGDASDIFAKVNTYANDIAFCTDVASPIQLKHTIREYNGTGGSELLVAHVLISSIMSSADTIIRCYYRDDGAADQQQTVYLAADNWVGRWGLHEAAAGVGGSAIYLDLSDNGYNGADYVSDTGKTGLIGDGQVFDGSDYIEMAAACCPANYITVEALIKTAVASGDHQIIIHDKGGTQVDGRVWQFRVEPDNVQFIVFTEAPDIGVATSTGTVNDNVWYHVAGTWDGTTVLTYIDGSNDGSDTLSGALRGPGAYKTFIGAREGPADWWIGSIDEAGMRGVASSANWLLTTSNCELDNDNFWTVGSEILVPKGQPAIRRCDLVPYVPGGDGRLTKW